MNTSTTTSISSNQKIFEEMKKLLSASLKSDEKSFKSLDRIEKLLRVNLAKIQRMYDDSMMIGSAKDSLTKTTKPETKVAPQVGSAPQIMPVTELPEQEVKPTNYESETDIDIPGKKQKPPAPRKPTPPPVSASPGIGTLAKVGTVGTVAAVLGGLVGLGFNKKSQLPETEQEAAERGVALSKENPIFSESPRGLAQVLDQPEFAAQTRRGTKLEREKKMQEAVETGPPKPSVVRQEQRRQEAIQPQNFTSPTEKMAAVGYTSIPSRARKNPEVSEQTETSNVDSGKSSAPARAPSRDVQAARKEVRAAQERGAEVRAAATEQGMTGKVSGKYEGGQLTKVSDESGREVDLTDRLTPEQRKNVNAAREMKAANERSTELQNQLTQESAQNRELNREAPAGQVQPVVIHNNNNMASQNFVPIQAQPRLPSSFLMFQQRNAAY